MDKYRNILGNDALIEIRKRNIDFERIENLSNGINSQVFLLGCKNRNYIFNNLASYTSFLILREKK